jgi:hypothetical protein
LLDLIFHLVFIVLLLQIQNAGVWLDVSGQEVGFLLLSILHLAVSTLSLVGGQLGRGVPLAGESAALCWNDTDILYHWRVFDKPADVFAG